MAIKRYFASISRTVEAQERYDTGEVTGKGQPIYRTRPIVNDQNEKILVTEYIKPPSMTGLCIFLDITRETWREYCDPVLNPQFVDTTTRTRARMENYLEEQLVTREKTVQGIIFNLQNNYGWRDKREVELGDKTRAALDKQVLSMNEREELLRELAREFANSGELTVES